MPVLFVRQRGSAYELRDNFPTIAHDRVNTVGQDRILWRWTARNVFPDRMEINPLRVHSLSANKPAMRMLCTDHGIRIPLTLYTAEQARDYFSTSTVPLLWRPAVHHAGQNMVVVNTAEEVTQTEGYWSQILPKTNEYRLYMLFGRVLGIDEKIVPDPTQLAWNHSLGGVFHVLRWGRWPSAMSHMATKVVAAAGLHFAAVDVIKSDGQFYFLETNTSPAMTSDYKVGLLRKAVSWIEEEVTRTGNLPAIMSPLPNVVRGYSNYIHPLHNGREEG